VDKNKYLVGFIALAVGFIISFFLTTSYNKNNAPAASATGPSSAMPAAGGGGNQQAQMAQVQQTIERAKSNPKDFQAQLDAAKTFYQVNRLPETVEYLTKAYEINPGEFTKQSGNELKGALGFIAIYYSDQKKYDEAERWFNRALEASPNDPEIRIELASTFIQREPPAPDKAIQELQGALKSNPRDAHALGHLVEAYALKKDARGAEDALNNLKGADPANQRLGALQAMVADLKAGKSVSIPKE
jgi:tetratricopeptide (TPR) repeat protein